MDSTVCRLRNIENIRFTLTTALGVAQAAKYRISRAHNNQFYQFRSCKAWASRRWALTVSQQQYRSSMPSMWLSACGALPRFATVGWRRTLHGCTPASRWQTCICCGDDCCHRGGRAPCESDAHNKARETRRSCTVVPSFAHVSVTFIVPFILDSARTAACAELP